MKKPNKEGFAPHPINWSNQKAQRLWDYYGASRAHQRKYFGESVGPHLVRVLQRRGLFRRAKNIVDLSCGTGALIAHILSRATSEATVAGYDPSLRSVQKANRRNVQNPAFAGAFQISEYPTSIPDGAVDLLLLTEVVEHLDDENLSRVLSECYRVLSPKGTLIVTTPNEEDLEAANVLCPECGCTFHMWQHQRVWKANSLKDTLNQAGFRRVKIKKITWGNELINLAFIMLKRKPTGLLAIAQR